MSTANADSDHPVIHGSPKVHGNVKRDGAKVAATPARNSLAMLIACLVVSR
jgi:UDP-N-acetylglucosamine enolpyruvyl transferase